jgi:hypothetical protein
MRKSLKLTPFTIRRYEIALLQQSKIRGEVGARLQELTEERRLALGPEVARVCSILER